jgi:hypothetical protein
MWNLEYRKSTYSSYRIDEYAYIENGIRDNKIKEILND